MTQPTTTAPATEPAALPEGATDPSVAAREPEETTEQKIARLEAEKRKAEEAVENERKLRLAHEDNLRRTRQELEARQAPQTTGSVDPLDQMIAELQEEKRILAANNFPTAAVDSALYEREREREWRRYQARIQEQRQAAEREFSAMESNPELKPFVAKAQALFFDTGNFASPQVALDHVRALEAPDTKRQLEELRRKNEELERDLKARAEGRVSAGSAPVLSIEKPPDPSQKIRVRRSDWNRLDTLPPHVQRDWNAAYREGRLEFIEG